MKTLKFLLYIGMILGSFSAFADGTDNTQKIQICVYTGIDNKGSSLLTIQQADVIGAPGNVMVTSHIQSNTNAPGCFELTFTGVDSPKNTLDWIQSQMTIGGVQWLQRNWVDDDQTDGDPSTMQYAVQLNLGFQFPNNTANIAYCGGVILGIQDKNGSKKQDLWTFSNLNNDKAYSEKITQLNCSSSSNVIAYGSNKSLEDTNHSSGLYFRIGQEKEGGLGGTL